MPKHLFLFFIAWMTPSAHEERCRGAAARVQRNTTYVQQLDATPLRPRTHHHAAWNEEFTVSSPVCKCLS
jgi:hypothetical protein